MKATHLKIAYILPSLANKGPVLVVKDLVSYLRDKADVTVFYFDPIKELDFECKTVNIKFSEGFDFSEFDIVHSHMLRPDAYVFLHRRKIKAKCISTLHSYVEKDLENTHGKLLSFIFTRIWNQLLRKHDMLVALTEHMQNYYRKLYSNPNITYIYNGKSVDKGLAIEATDLLKIKEFKEGSILLGVSAILTHIKGIDQTIKLLERLPYLKLLIIGDGPAKNDLLRLAESRQVSERCLFLGYRSHANRYYSQFDVYAMSSRSEGFSLALIEAAAYGLPTVSSNIPTAVEAFTGEEVSFYELENLDSMQKATEHLLANKSKFSSNILSKYHNAYTASKMASQYNELYKQL
ncbi:glycosyltransferase family 4 protein [Pontibacter litorisediminis]|uniref:glycosyltransferase family 4 protein n=1 Tax=Pontibacter litorisediminis TaxID=1846260 RepID=UPI0023EAFBCF|nr:glycosyltransferase family 4 protein [Pontibacter litorisediminis]